MLTGIQIINLGDFFSLRIFGKKVEQFELGILSSEETMTTTHSYSNNVLTVDAKLPGLEQLSNKYQVSEDAFIELGSIEAGYMFDLTDVTFEINSPVAGIGLLHYTNSEYFAGYVRPFLVPLNYTSFLGL